MRRPRRVGAKGFVTRRVAESFKGRDHLRPIQEEVYAIIQEVFTTEAAG